MSISVPRRHLLRASTLALLVGGFLPLTAAELTYSIEALPMPSELTPGQGTWQGVVSVSPNGRWVLLEAGEEGEGASSYYRYDAQNGTVFGMGTIADVSEVNAESIDDNGRVVGGVVMYDAQGATTYERPFTAEVGYAPYLYGSFYGWLSGSAQGRLFGGQHIATPPDYAAYSDLRTAWISESVAAAPGQARAKVAVVATVPDLVGNTSLAGRAAAMDALSPDGDVAAGSFITSTGAPSFWRYQISLGSLVVWRAPNALGSAYTALTMADDPDFEVVGLTDPSTTGGGIFSTIGLDGSATAPKRTVRTYGFDQASPQHQVVPAPQTASWDWSVHDWNQRIVTSVGVVDGVTLAVGQAANIDGQGTDSDWTAFLWTPSEGSAKVLPALTAGGDHVWAGRPAISAEGEIYASGWDPAQTQYQPSAKRWIRLTPMPVVSVAVVGSATLAEGSPGQDSTVLRVSRSGGTAALRPALRARVLVGGAMHPFEYSVAGGNAEVAIEGGNAFYHHVTVTIPAGQASVDVTFTAVDNTDDFPIRTVSIDPAPLPNNQGTAGYRTGTAFLAGTGATLTLIDNDEPTWPVATITPVGQPADAPVSGPVTLAIEFSEAVSGLTLSGLMADIGTLSGLTGSGASYRVLYTPPAGMEGAYDTVALLESAAVAVSDGDAAVGQGSLLIDTDAPILPVIIHPSQGEEVGSGFMVSGTYDGPAGDTILISTGGATVPADRTTGIAWSATLSEIAEGTATISVTGVDDAGNVGPTATVQVVVANPVGSFVARFYQQCLQRSPDAAGLADWAGSLRGGSRAGADVARGFVLSQEFRNRNLSNRQYLTVLYRAFFDREPDAGGLDGWLAQLDSGVQREDVLYGFINAQEFTNLCNRYGISPISSAGTQRYQVRQFVRRFYQQCLSREPDEGGINDWTEQLVGGTRQGSQIADGFVNSQEFINRRTGDTQFLTILYRAFFDREPDAGGLATWTATLSGGGTRQQVLDGFTHAQEFANLCARYGISPLPAAR